MNIIDIITPIMVAAATITISIVIWVLGNKVRGLVSTFCNTETKIKIAKIAVNAVEQIVTKDDLNFTSGEKFEMAADYIQMVLKKSGINIGAEECEMLIESAVKEMNECWTSIKGEILDLGDDADLETGLDAEFATATVAEEAVYEKIND